MKLQATSFEHNKAILQEYFRIDVNFDMKCREFIIGDKKACIYFINGFVKDEGLQRLMEFLANIKSKNMPANAELFLQELLPYGEVDVTDCLHILANRLLAGITFLLIEGYDTAITVDCREYPSRGVEESEKDKVMRGSRDGFVETLISNTALIRRRIRDTNLTMEHFTIGKMSKTDVVMSYLKGRVDQDMLQKLRRQLSEIEIDSLTMNQESLAECLFHKPWINPFPKFKFSERPDTTAAAILEGNIVILVDNSPAAMILPISIFDIIEEADDYYFPPVTGTYLRFSRTIINITALILTPLFLLFVNHTQWIPDSLSFITFQERVHVPPFFQFLILEFAIDGLRLAALNTPSNLSTPLSVVAGIVLGDFTVSSGWFNAECMLYMSFVAIATYSQASFELGYALKFMRLILLTAVQLFGLYGFVAGLIFVLFVMVKNRTLAGKSYLYPLIPFHWSNVLRRFFRVSVPTNEKVVKNKNWE